MKSELKKVLEGIDYLFGRVNWGESNLDAQAIDVMNNLRGRIRKGFGEKEDMSQLDIFINSLITDWAIKKNTEELVKDTESDAYETSCGNMIVEGEEFQVKVIVTRKTEDFLDPFDIVQHVTRVL